MSPNQNTQSGTPGSTQASGSGSGGGGKTIILYLVAAIVVILVVIGVVLLFSSSSPTVAVTQNHSESSTPIYLSSSQAGLILNSSLESYNTQDMFDSAAYINMSYLESIVPALANNVTSAWITTASGSNLTANASVEYMEFETANASAISGALFTSLINSYNTTVPATYGTANGMDYSYGVFKNATYGTQFLSGWKGNGVVLVVVQSYPSFTANESTIVGIAENDTV